MLMLTQRSVATHALPLTWHMLMLTKHFLMKFFSQLFSSCVPVSVWQSDERHRQDLSAQAQWCAEVGGCWAPATGLRTNNGCLCYSDRYTLSHSLYALFLSARLLAHVHIYTRAHACAHAHTLGMLVSCSLFSPNADWLC